MLQRPDDRRIYLGEVWTGNDTHDKQHHAVTAAVLSHLQQYPALQPVPFQHPAAPHAAGRAAPAGQLPGNRPVPGAQALAALQDHP